MFICFEGVAGSGKTTQTKLLADYLKSVKKKEVFISAAYESDRRKAVSDFMNTSGIKPDQNAVNLKKQPSGEGRGLTSAGKELLDLG